MVCLFPPSAQEIILKEIADDWDQPFDDVRLAFDQISPLLKEFYLIAWTRWLEPTSAKLHEITPLVARVRAQAATRREILYLGAYSVAAIGNADDATLAALRRLGTKKLSKPANIQLLMAALDFYDRHKRPPRFAELKKFVESAENSTRYLSVTTANWTRHVRESGACFLIALATKATEGG